VLSDGAAASLVPGAFSIGPRGADGTVADVVRLHFSDDEGNEVLLDERDSASLLALTANLEEATVSACPGCACRVLAAVALVDLLDAAPPHAASVALVELADEAPTLHLYVIDVETDCEHDRWLDPGHEEWSDATGDDVRPQPRN
jgi:hypothetical protein